MVAYLRPLAHPVHHVVEDLDTHGELCGKVSGDTELSRKPCPITSPDRPGLFQLFHENHGKVWVRTRSAQIHNADSRK